MVIKYVLVVTYEEIFWISFSPLNLEFTHWKQIQ